MADGVSETVEGCRGCKNNLRGGHHDGGNHRGDNHRSDDVRRGAGSEREDAGGDGRTAG